jgi:hypothetical protein
MCPDCQDTGTYRVYEPDVATGAIVAVSGPLPCPRGCEVDEDGEVIEPTDVYEDES